MSQEGEVRKTEGENENNPSEVLRVVREKWVNPIDLQELTEIGLDKELAMEYLKEKAEHGTTSKQSLVDQLRENYLKKNPKMEGDETTPTTKDDAEKIDIVKVEIHRKLGGKNGGGGGNEKKPETNIAEQFEQKFGVSKEEFAELEKNEDFKNLTHGQRLFVLKNLEQVSLDRATTEGQLRFEEELKKKGILGKIGTNLIKEGVIASHKKDIVEEIQKGGLSLHKETVEQLVGRAMMMNVPMIENERGELEMQFGKINEKMTPEEQAIVHAYNKSATEFAFTPHEWDGFRGGGWAENNKYDDRKVAFYKSLETYSALVKKYDLPEDASVMRKINLQQFLTTNPDAEQVMHKLSGNANAWKRTFGKDILVERGVYFGLGYAARGAAPLLTAAQAAAPIASFVVGSIRGGFRASSDLRTRERRARRGIKDETKTAKNFVDAFETPKDGTDKRVVRSMGERLEDLTRAYENAQTEEEKKLIAKQLINRSQYTLRKMEDGLINFGTPEMRIFNQTRLMDVIAKAECYAAENGEEGAEMKKRLNHFLNIRGNRIDMKQDIYIAKQAIKAGLFGAAFATAGLLAKDIGHEIKELFTTHTTTRGIDVPKIKLRSEEIPLAEHNVPKYIPGNHHTTIDSSNFEKPQPPTDYAPVDKTRVAMDDPRFKILGPVDESAPIPGTAPIPPYAEGYDVKPVEVTFDHGRGAIATFKELQEKLAAEYKGVDAAKIPPSVKEIIDGNPTKLAQKFGFYDPNSEAESALVIKGSSLSIDSAGNLDYHHVGNNTYHILEFEDGARGYNYDEKMFDYQGAHSTANSEHRFDGNGEEQKIEYVDETDEAADTGTHHFDIKEEQKIISGHETIKESVGQTTKEPVVKQFQSWDGHPRKTSVGHYNTVGKESYRTSVGGGAMNGQVYNPATGRWEGPGTNPQAPDNNWYRTRDGRYYSPNDPHRPIYNYSGHDINPNNRVIDTTPHTPEETVVSDEKFSGQTNRQYRHLIEEVFGNKEPVTGDTTYDEEILKMFKEHSALDDIDSEPDLSDTKDMQEYYRIVQQVHESSGLEPKSTDTTGLYVKEALEKMKHDGINIRQFVKALIKDKGVENFVDSTEETVTEEDSVYQ